MLADLYPRCGCGKLLALAVSRPWAIRCPRCKAENSGTLEEPRNQG